MSATRFLIWTAAKGIAQGAVSFMHAPQLIVSEGVSSNKSTLKGNAGCTLPCEWGPEFASL